MKTKIEIIQGDITQLNLDAIVNAANNRLRGGGGVDGAIHRAGGPSILQECLKIGYCQTGQAVITTAGNLQAKYIIHTVGPIYSKNNVEQEKLLYNAYYNSLLLGSSYDEIKTLAFPSISTGVYGYPFNDASKIALEAAKNFTEQSDHYTKIVFVLFSEGDFSKFILMKDKIL